VIAGVGAIGCCPSQRNKNKTDECNEETNSLSVKYNEALTSMLQGLKSELKDINYSYINTYSVFQNFIQKPSTYGKLLFLLKSKKIWRAKLFPFLRFVPKIYIHVWLILSSIFDN
jgi:hypothetical protein